MRLNVERVLAEAAAEEKRVKPLPVIRVNGKRQSTVHSPRSTVVRPQPVDRGQPTVDLQPQSDDLNIKISELKRARGKLSTRTAYLVQEFEAKLRAESPAVADEFMKGNLPMPELADHYAEIQALTDKIGALWEQQRHFEQTGEMQLPVASYRLPEADQQLDAMHHEVRRLDDLIYKTTKKLNHHNAGLKKPKNSDRVFEWKEKIALANARRHELKEMIKRKQYERRTSLENGTAKN